MKDKRERLRIRYSSVNMSGRFRDGRRVNIRRSLESKMSAIAEGGGSSPKTQSSEPRIKLCVANFATE